MNVPADGRARPGAVRPARRPADPRFSTGPCRKHPGWDAARLATTTLGRSHRAAGPKARLNEAIRRQAALLGLPEDWRLAIVPASDTGAVEIAMWSLLGARGVDVFAWESFSRDWAVDAGDELALPDLRIHSADYGALPDLTQADPARDVVFVYNGTTSGVCVPNLDWIARERAGLSICDATSAAFAYPLDFARLDVVTWSWQKILGGEAGFGMLALSPRALERLETFRPPRPLPKLFRLTRAGRPDAALFEGATINTPSLLAVEDLHSALDWAESLGGLDALIRRSRENFAAVDAWVGESAWLDWLPEDPATRSTTSLCLRLTGPEFAALDTDAQRAAVKTMCAWLEDENVALDIAAYRTAPPGFRLWGGATVDSSDLAALMPWLDWAHARWLAEHAAASVST